MKNLGVLLSVFCLLVVCASPAAAQSLLWEKTFGGADFDAGRGVAKTSDGGYILAVDLNYDLLLLKTDADGNELWSSITGQRADVPQDIIVTSDGSYVISGTTSSYGATYGDFLLLKTDSAGIVQWASAYGGLANDLGYDLEPTSDGGYIMVGCTFSFGAGMTDTYLVKADANGVEQWSKYFGGTNWEAGYGVKQTADGGYIIAGYTASMGAGSYDGWLIKTDANGIEQWNQTYGGTGYDILEDIEVTDDGGFIITGQTYSSGAGSSDVWLVKTDGNGVEQWSSTFGTDSFEQCYNLEKTSDGGYVMAGRNLVPITYDSNLLVVKTDSSGAELWSASYGGDKAESPMNIIEADDGHFIVVGGTASSGAGSWDAWLLKISNGVVDEDADGIPDDEDNCLDLPNPDQADTDEDGAGDLCDICMYDPEDDADGDGLCADVDACPYEDATGFDANIDGCIDSPSGLIDVINTLPDETLSDQTKNSLASKVDSALASIDKEKDDTAINQLNAFINEVGAQRGKKISEEVADMLIAYAQNIIAQIELNDTL